MRRRARDGAAIVVDVTLGSAVPARRLSLAIVDDEASVRVALRRLCLAFGLNAVAYASGREFLDSLESEPHPDCLLLDTQMPEMTGLEVQRHLLARPVRFPTIVVTADDAPETRARFVAAGVAEYLRKPIDGDELLAAIERAVSKNAGREEEKKLGT